MDIITPLGAGLLGDAIYVKIRLLTFALVAQLDRQRISERVGKLRATHTLIYALVVKWIS